VTGTVAEKRPGGRRIQKRDRRGPAAQLASLGFGALLTGLAWVFLVGAAIDFGVAAVGGQTPAWLFMVGATIGAVVCLVLMLTLGARGLRSLGFLSEHQPKRVGARRKR
jgi:hypothetical protein